MTLIQRVGLFVVGLVLLGVAGFLLWMSTRQGRLAARSAEWPQTVGIVTSSGVSGTYVKQGPVQVMVYAASVRYTYEVGGVPHEGSRIGFGDEWTGTPGESGRARAEAQAASWPEGAKAVVFYDPDDPSQSALVKGGEVPFSSKSGTGVAIMMVLMGITCLGFAVRWGR